MFDEYLNVYELYKSFIISYPIILIIPIIFFMLIYVLYYFNIIYYITFVINYIYLIIILLIYFVITIFCCNTFVIGLLTYSMSIIYNIAIGIYANVSAFLYYFKFFVILYVLYLVITNQTGYIYNMIIFIFDTIIMIVYSLLIFIVETIFSSNIYVNLAVIYVIILLYIYYKLWFSFDVDMLKIDKDVKIINEHKNINTIVKTDDIYDAVEIVSQRLNLYKYKYFINLYDKADSYYSTKEEYLKEQMNINNLKGNNDNNIANKSIVDTYIEGINSTAVVKLGEFKKDVQEKKTTKINKEFSEKNLQLTKDELTKKKNELYSKKTEEFLINRKINPKINNDLQKSYVEKKDILKKNINDINTNIQILAQQKKSIKEQKDKYNYDLSTRKKIIDAFKNTNKPVQNQP
jgi:hypothetical protein